MGDYNRDLIAVQVLLLSCALHCVFSSVGMTCLIIFFFGGGGGIWQAEWRRWSSGRVEEQHSDQLAELVVLHSKLCGDLSNTISFFFLLTPDKDTVLSSSWIQVHTCEAEAEE